MELSELALQKLLQLFPEISSYIVNFRDITEEAGKEESGIRIGLFILQLGEDYYYIPVIAKNETVLPIDSLFNATTGTFVPLTRSFIDKTISASQVYLGKATKVPTTVTQNPSVYEMVTPPRTGKNVYASSSRLVEFLGIMPNMVKQAMTEKFASDKEVYEALHKMFGLDNIFAALKPTAAVEVKLKPAIELIEEGVGLDNETIKSILDKGYALRGENTTNRVAVMAQDYDSLGPLHTINGIEVGADYEVVLNNGEIRSAYIPRRIRGSTATPTLLGGQIGGRGHHGNSMFVLFSDGTFCVTDQVIARGEAHMSKKALRDMFANVPAITPKHMKSYSGHDYAFLTPDLDLIGVYSVSSVVETPAGVTIKAYSELSGDARNVTINAYRNCTKIDVSMPDNIFVPYNTLVVGVKRNSADILEANINSALERLKLSTLQAVGSAMHIGFDGIEFVVNGKPLGVEKQAMEHLVIKEGIDPVGAEKFLKYAQEHGSAKIYISKKADWEPTEIPQFGDIPPEQQQTFGADGDGSFSRNLKSSLETQDKDVVESMVISELLQATDMNSLVKEYLPEIQAAIDKLGRTLFLARLNMDKLSGDQNSNELMSFIANLRNVYRLLGDNVTKLERMVSGPETAQEEAGTAK
jgi:hypothetical protein